MAGQRRGDLVVEFVDVARGGGGGAVARRKAGALAAMSFSPASM